MMKNLTSRIFSTSDLNNWNVTCLYQINANRDFQKLKCDFQDLHVFHFFAVFLKDTSVTKNESFFEKN